MKRILCTAAIGFTVFAATTAIAADGYVTGDVDLRAGPDPSYPTVATLGNGTPVSIQGCVDNWSWCDVATPNDRGWVAGDFLQEEYQGQRVYVPEFGIQIGIPIVSFSFGTYWDTYYHGRPFFAERDRWSKVRPVYRAPVHVHADSRPSREPAAQAKQSAMTAAPPAPHAQAQHTVAPPHPVAAQSRPAEHDVIRTKPAEAQAMAPKPESAPQRAVASERRPSESAPANDAGQPERKVAAAKPAPKLAKQPTPKPPEHENNKEGDKDKDQH